MNLNHLFSLKMITSSKVLAHFHSNFSGITRLLNYMNSLKVAQNILDELIFCQIVMECIAFFEKV